MYYGGAFGTFQSTVSAVWDSNYKGVWHFGDGGTISIMDSTGTNTATNHGATVAAGKMGGAVNFVATSNQYIDAGGSGTGSSTVLTMEGWFNLAINSSPSGLFGNGNYPTNPGGGAEIYLNSGGIYDNVQLEFFNNGTYGNRSSTATNLYTTGTWHHVAGTITGTDRRFYIDGTQITSFTDYSTATSLSSTPANFNMGRFTRGSAYITGLLDEVRISNSVRSADWILTEYRNQSAPGSYISAGTRITSAGSTPARHRVMGGG
jgi:hypothetical protein